MLNRFKTAIYSAVSGIDASGEGHNRITADSHSDSHASRPNFKFPYTRPQFLQFSTEDEVMVSADHAIRPIIVPRDVAKIPWKSGYAESINAGKSAKNEDQAVFSVSMLRRKPAEGNNVNTPPNGPENSVPYVYFAVFDGHAGTGAAIVAYNSLHKVIHEKLTDVFEILLSTTKEGKISKPNNVFPEREITSETLIVGALESAFWEMDEQIANERVKFKITGGCTVLVAIFILGKLYLANAGDSRAIICRKGKVVPMSQDFTPESERQRIRNLALVQPELLGGEYTALEFARRPLRKDIGKRMLCREPYMTGWALKTVTAEDLRFPLIYGEGKRSRVLATIGVTRGFGDHDLKAQNGNVNIKPFLTPQPEVRIFDIAGEEMTTDDVLVMGTDGLWDITTNEMAAEIVQRSLDHFPATDENRYRYRYTSAAQDLVMHSRGKLKERGWKTADDKPATIDDITVFVIPLLEYKKEFLKWREASRFTAQVHQEPRVVRVQREEVPNANEPSSSVMSDAQSRDPEKTEVTEVTGEEKESDRQVSDDEVTVAADDHQPAD